MKPITLVCTALLACLSASAEASPGQLLLCRITAQQGSDVTLRGTQVGSLQVNDQATLRGGPGGAHKHGVAELSVRLGNYQANITVYDSMLNMAIDEVDGSGQVIKRHASSEVGQEAATVDRPAVGLRAPVSGTIEGQSFNILDAGCSIM